MPYIKRFIKKLYRKFFGPHTEIEFVEAALKRYHARLHDMRIDQDTYCDFWSLEERELSNKIDRVEAWLEVLKKRKQKNESI